MPEEYLGTGTESQDSLVQPTVNTGEKGQTAHALGAGALQPRARQHTWKRLFTQNMPQIENTLSMGHFQ